jgi:pyruvate,water dikinase
VAPEELKLLESLETVSGRNQTLAGGKGFALARMCRSGLHVPHGIVILTPAYEAFMDRTGLRERVSLELSRKDFGDMRWEELWDAALRIRNMFITTPMPDALANRIEKEFPESLAERPLVVRSSSPVEDSAGASFAGLHESYVNVRGIPDMLKHVRLVWASLWSDRALLYRQELGLDVSHSSMAVVVQELVEGDCSGIAFSRSPSDSSQVAVEAVYGLNQGLVDGDISPDHWLLKRHTGEVVSHAAPAREQKCIPANSGTTFESLTCEEENRPPLDAEALQGVYEMALRAEKHFGMPEDVEWTIRGGELYVLQSRPITRGSSIDDEGRSWYLSLTRTFENLMSLRRTVPECFPNWREGRGLFPRRSASICSIVWHASI